MFKFRYNQSEVKSSLLHWDPHKYTDLLDHKSEIQRCRFRCPRTFDEQFEAEKIIRLNNTDQSDLSISNHRKSVRLALSGQDPSGLQFSKTRDFAAGIQRGVLFVVCVQDGVGSCGGYKISFQI